MCTAAGLPRFGWNDAVPDEEVGRCSVHAVDCEGQHTHSPPVPGEHDHSVRLDGSGCPVCGYVTSTVPAGEDRHA